MARNGSGTYTVPKSFTPLTAITSSDQNTNWSDIGAEMTNSLALDGQSVMTGAFKGASGSNTTPSITFGADLDTGLYRKASNQIGVAVGGTEVAYFDSLGIHGVGSTPPGAISAYAGSSAPSGWLLCYGQDISRSDYAALFSAIGTTYGSGDGSTTFALPDLRGRVIAGKDNMGGTSANRLTDQSGGLDGDTLGDTGGEETHTISTAEMPAHDHGGATGQKTAESLSKTFKYLNVAAGGRPVLATDSNSDVTGTESTSLATVPAHTHTISSQGDGGAHNNVQPTIILNYIIKT